MIRVGPLVFYVCVCGHRFLSMTGLVLHELLVCGNERLPDRVPDEPCPGCGGSTHDGQPVWDDAQGTPWHLSCLDARSERFSHDPTQRAEATTTPEGAKGWVDQAGSAQVLAGGHGLDVAPDASPEGSEQRPADEQDGGGKPSNAPNAARTFNELFEPQLVLSLTRTPSGTYAVTDQTGRLYTFGEPSLTMCVNFIRRFAALTGALIDDASVEAATWTAAYAGTHSVKVPDGLSERAGTTPAEGREARSESPSNVVPIRRGA